MSENSKYVIGVMSGTSLDGLDLVYTKISKENSKYTYRILECETFGYSKVWEEKLRNSFNESQSYLKELDESYGKYLGNKINSFIKAHSIEKLDFIASHGHTIFHKPEEGITLQIGSGTIISEVTGIRTIYDFRTQDVNLGGQGAPLVPIGDQLLFSDYEYCLNLGGFANISFEENNERRAFDICPVNIVMNHYVKKIGLDYDDKGEIAKTGTINEELLLELDSLEFYKDNAPKSLGFEFVVAHIFPLIDSYNLCIEDIMRTFIAHIVNQISSKIKTRGAIFVTGGGAYNLFLIHQMQKRMSNAVIVPENKLINFKEALIFAFLGVLREYGEVNCLKSVTGANRDHCSGRVSNPLL